jgi:hypothetical protein
VRASGLALVLLICGVSCGTSADEETPASQGRSSAPGSLSALQARPGEDVALVMGTSDYAAGPVRLSFLVIASNGRPVFTPSARVWVARERGARPFAKAEARLERLGVPGGDHADHFSGIYVAHVRIPRAGRYWLLAEPQGGPMRVQGLAELEVADDAKTPAVGEEAPASDTPTLADVGGDAEKLTTREPPDVGMLRHSVEDVLKRGEPFVLVFATPKFCTSRTCGPVVDVADVVRKRYEKHGVRFVHVEIYEELNPALGPNRWVQEWKLPNEPWTFVVGGDGRIRAKFEGAVSVRELDVAVGGLVGEA